MCRKHTAVLKLRNPLTESLNAKAATLGTSPIRKLAMKQNIQFCTAPDGVRLAYAVSGDGPARDVRDVAYPSRASVAEPGLAALVGCFFSNLNCCAMIYAAAGCRTETHKTFRLKPGSATLNPLSMPPISSNSRFWRRARAVPLPSNTRRGIRSGSASLSSTGPTRLDGAVAASTEGSREGAMADPNHARRLGARKPCLAAGLGRCVPARRYG